MHMTLQLCTWLGFQENAKLNPTDGIMILLYCYSQSNRKYMNDVNQFKWRFFFVCLILSSYICVATSIVLRMFNIEIFTVFKWISFRFYEFVENREKRQPTESKQQVATKPIYSINQYGFFLR